MKHLSDEALMKRVADGDLDVMHHLYHRFRDKIYNYALMMVRDKELSMDITQDVFYRVIKHRRTYKGSRFSPWIYAIARNLCHDYHKMQTKSDLHLADQGMLENTLDEVPEVLGNDAQLEQAMNGLAAADKELIFMSKFHKMKYQEIAAITDSTEGAIKTRVHRALLKLKEQYFKISKTS